MYIRKEVKSTARSQGIEVMVPSGRKKKLRRKAIEGDAEEWKEIRFNDRTSGKGRIEKSCRRPRRIGADERKEFGEWECHDLFFHYNGNAVRDGEGWIETDFAAHAAIGKPSWNF